MKTLNEVLKDWEAVIGLEVHTELTTLETKMFCGCKLSHDDEPNANVCPVCLGMPGALPVPNKDAIRSIVKAGLATNCQIMPRSMFYRKHYFYPDMAKNFQTTQGPVAFCMHGHLGLEVAGEGAKERPADSKNVEWAADKTSYETEVRILRIHMEEDAAKMVHVGGEEGRIASATESLIDYNRCGTPLIELVTEPDLRTPEEARLFMEKLRRIFLTLGISDCSLESGSMRCDGNVSLRRRGETTLGTKTELKNINSFKSLHDGLEYEIRRQAEVLESGGEVFQETRHWEPGKKRTVVMRVKETADDYRLFPDPDLAPFDLSEEFVESCRKELPELPDAKRDRYVATFGIKRADAAQMAADPEVAAFFEAAIAAAPAPKAKKAADKLNATVANIVVNDLPGYLKSAGVSLAECAVTPGQVAELAGLLVSDAISSTAGREVFAEMAKTGKAPEKIVDEKGLRQVTDDSALLPVVQSVVAACPDQVAQFKGGNTKVVGYLVGQCMKAAKGQGNPKRFNELLVEAMSGDAAEAAAEPVEAAKAETKPAVKAEAKPAAKAAAKKVEAAKAEVKPAAKAAAKKADKPAAKVAAVPKGEAPKAEAKPVAKKAAAAPKVEAPKAEAKVEEKAKPAPKPEPKPAPKKAAPKPAAAKAAPAPKVEAPKPEVKPAPKKAAAPKAEAVKPEAKPVAKKAAPAPKPEAPKPEAKPEPKVEEKAKPASKKAAPAPKPEATKLEPKVEEKAKPAPKPAEAPKPVAKPAPKKAAPAPKVEAPKPEVKPAPKKAAAPKAEAVKAEAKPVAKKAAPAPKAEAPKPETKPANKPASNKPASRAALKKKPRKRR